MNRVSVAAVAFDPPSPRNSGEQATGREHMREPAAAGREHVRVPRQASGGGEQADCLARLQREMGELDLAHDELLRRVAAADDAERCALLQWMVSLGADRGHTDTPWHEDAQTECSIPEHQSAALGGAGTRRTHLSLQI